jgi:hypothetical protein
MTDETSGDSLGRAIGEIRREVPRVPRQKPASAEGAGSARPGLEHILAGEFGGEVRAAAPQSPSERPAGKDALAQLAEERHTTSASPPATHPRSLSRPIAMAVFGLVLLFAVPFIQRQRAEPAEAAITFQSQVERLGQAVDDYKKTHGNLPVSPAQLPQFPANGIEANLRDYRLRLLTDQPEFFFVREATGGFVLLGRYRGEVWMYSEGSRRPLRRVDKQGA